MTTAAEYNNNTSNHWKRIFSEEVLPQVILNPKKIKLRKCICGIRFDCVLMGFKVSNIIQTNRTHTINVKTNKPYVLCDRCRTQQKKYKDDNKEHAKPVKKLYEATPERQMRRQELRQQPHNQEKNKERMRQYRSQPDVIERRKEYIQQYKQKPEVKERIREYNTKPKVKAKRNARQHERYHTDIVFKCRQILSRTLGKKLRAISNGTNIKKNTMEFLGCTIDEFKEYIESKFEEGMSWDNYGRKPDTRCWELDHITPAKYKEDDTEEITVETIVKRSHYTNFQPMWAIDNQKKNNKFIG